VRVVSNSSCRNRAGPMEQRLAGYPREYLWGSSPSLASTLHSRGHERRGGGCPLCLEVPDLPRTPICETTTFICTKTLTAEKTLASTHTFTTSFLQRPPRPPRLQQTIHRSTGAIIVEKTPISVGVLASSLVPVTTSISPLISDKAPSLL
jgi:hypothetical protein